MVDYALMNQCLYEGKAKEVEQMTKDALAEGRSVQEVMNEGLIAGEQVTPGAPWQIRLTDELRARFVEEAPPEYLPMLEATLRLGVSRQTVLQRVKRGELEAVHVRCGRRKGLRIKVLDTQPSLFPPAS